MEYFNGEFKELEELARSKMSRVFLAEHKRTGKKWAIKQIYNYQNRYLGRELDILKKLEHIALPIIMDHFEDYDKSDLKDGTEIPPDTRIDTYVVMQYIEGKTLHDSPFPDGGIPELSAKDYLRRLCDVFSYLHEQNDPPIIHKDLKPKNLIRDNKGNLYLIDFGISKDTPDFEIKGYTEGFAAPEQDYNNGAVTDKRTDIYSLGATIYFLLSGTIPDVPARPVSEVCKEVCPNVKVSEGMEHIIMKCLQKEPANRYQSIFELSKDLDRIDAFSTKRRTKVIVSAVCLILFTLLATNGIKQLQWEKEGRFVALLESGYNDIDKREYSIAEQAFTNCIQLYPKRVEGYIGLSNLYMSRREYRESERVLIDAESKLNGSIPDGQFYHCLGRTYYYLNNHERALDAFKMAVSFNQRNNTFRRDLAVCYAKLGMLESAKNELKLIESGGFDEFYVLAQIYEQQGNFDDALTHYEKCFVADDEALSVDAYIAAASIYDKNPMVEDALDKKIEILEKAENEGYQRGGNIILDMLGAAYYKKGSLATTQTDTDQYLNLALNKYLLLKNQQLGNLGNDINIAAIYQLLGRYGDCRQILDEAVDIYTNDYRPLFRLAILELEIQSKKPRENRNYELFKSFAERAIDLFDPEENEDILILKTRLRELNLGEW